jgi:hypothetical protein
MIRRSALHRASAFTVLATLLAAVALSPGAAQAATATKTIDGSPLDVFVSADGNLQAQLEGSAAKVFYPPSSDVGDAGFFLSFPDGLGSIVDGTTSGPSSMEFGPDVTLPFEFISAADPISTGSGYTQTTVYCVRPQDAPSCATLAPVEVTQVVSYVNGRRSFDVTWSVENNTGATLPFRAWTAADLYLDGSDHGTGYFSQGPPRVVGGVNELTGRAGGIQEVSGFPWTRHQESSFSSIWSIMTDPLGTGFNDSILSANVDNGVGVQWDNHYASGLVTGQTATFKATWQFGMAGLTASPVGAALNKGATHTVTFTGTDQNGQPTAGKLLRYTVTGANARSGAVTTNGAGQSAVSWRGDVAGNDVIDAYLDLDGNGARSTDEPKASATVLFKAPDAPLPATPGNAFTFSGAPVFGAGSTTLIIVVPGPGQISVTPAGAGASAAAKKGKKKAKKKPALIKKTTVKVKKAGPVKVKITPTKAGKKVIKSKGSLTTKVSITFTPTGGKPRTVVKKVKIKKNAAKPKKGKGGKGKSKS